MFAWMPSAREVRWGGTALLLTLAALPLCASCTKSEDTEPFNPAREGAKQPAGSVDLVSESEACERVRDAAEAAQARLRCGAPTPASCPTYLRPAGASGCFEYYESSVDACEKAYEGAVTCGALTPCIVSAERNDDLPTCELVESGAGGQGGAASSVGGATGGGGESTGQGGAVSPSEAGAPSTGGVGGAPGLAGAGGV